MDDFYYLEKPTIKKVKELLVWAKSHALRVDVDVLDCKKSFARQKSDKTFEQILPFIGKSSIDFLRVILRRNWNTFLILSNKLKIMDIVEVCIRSIDIDDKEYFFFIYLDVDKLEELKKRYKLKKI
jgi:DUF1365 family protein